MQGVSKEATLAEVMEHVSLADVGRAMKILIIAGACWGAFGLIGFGIAKAGEQAFSGIHIPAPIWESGLIAIYCLILTEGSTRHVFHWEYWFPKLRWIGIPLMTAYLVAIVEIWKASGFLWAYGALIPGIMFFVLCQEGYDKLMTARRELIAE